MQKCFREVDGIIKMRALINDKHWVYAIKSPAGMKARFRIIMHFTGGGKYSTFSNLIHVKQISTGCPKFQVPLLTQLFGPGLGWVMKVTHS